MSKQRRPIEWRNHKFKTMRRNACGAGGLAANNHNVEAAVAVAKYNWRWNRTPEEVAREREQNRIREHVRRLNRTPEEVLYERERNRLRERLRRSNRTPEQITRDREQNRVREQLRRLKRSPDEVLHDREQSRIRQHLRRSNRTTEEADHERRQNRVREQLRRSKRTNEEVVRDREDSRIREQVRRLPMTTTKPPTTTTSKPVVVSKPKPAAVVERNFGPSNLYLAAATANASDQSPSGEFEWFNEYLKMLGYHTCVCYQCSGLHCFAHANCMKDLCVSNGPKEVPPPLPSSCASDPISV